MTRVTNGALRGLLAALLVATPSLLLPGVSPDTTEVVALVGLALAALVWIEYATHYPSLIEFRDAPPFNRIRFMGLFATVFFLSLLVRGQAEASGLTLFVLALGHVLGTILDFAYSPVRLVLHSLPETATQSEVLLVRAAAGFAFMAAFISFIIFYLILKLADWPRRMGAFNVWINLPTFDPTTGGDVVTRLRRDARLNLALGFLLPFVLPAVMKASSAVFGPVSFSAGQTMVWLVAAWAFLPLSLFMRGIAMDRVADMIVEIRRRTSASHEEQPEIFATPG
ncbi:MAG: hypothetical protein AAF646_10740 [Pseudomonadota bacterium]